MKLKHTHSKLGIRALFSAVWLMAISVAAQDVIWANQGFADEQAIPANGVYAYNGGSVTVSWVVVESGGGMNVYPGSGTESGGGGDDYVSYESTGQIGGKDNIVVMSFNNDNDDPNDYVDVIYSFSEPQYGFKFTLLDIDSGSWDDGVEVTFNGTINLRDNPAWWSFENTVNATLIEDNETYFEGFEGAGTGNALANEDRGNLICNVSGGPITTLRYRFFSTDDADANPAGQKVGFTDLLVVQPNLITSTKSVADLNGGQVEPGDTLEYTVSVNEIAGNGAYVTVVDTLPAGLENLSVVSAPVDGTDASTTSNLNVSGFFVPGNESVDVVFQADVSTSPAPPNGTSITNTAIVTEAFGTTNTPFSAITVANSLPSLAVVKSSTVLSDPVNGSSNPKRIPGAVVEYRIQVNNSGIGGGDADSIELDDAIPQNTAMVVSDAYGPAGPVQFIPDTSGLTYSYSGLGNGSDDLSFHSATSTNYTPSASADGSDPGVTSVHLNPKGTLNGSSSFEFRFQVLVQ
ncbi:MAG: isopeptide-forming domain-containing fimbrial protein [Pontiella sp.]|nr:isopeptide-forming domain-containing fimbrial protein [Pontiella sp.]